ncbi:MAG: hypothetical protein R3266_10205, partial [Gemmatimonadota bacterium]|nr:hypothetical protein [Gemmatimonadota bacterium]
MDGKLMGLVRDTVVGRFGEELWTSLSGPCAGLENAEPSDALACWIGRESVPALRDAYPSLFDRHADLTSFVAGLGDDLPAVRTADAGGPHPTFRHGFAPDGSILLRIEAPCSMCALIEGVIAGAAVHYGEPVLIGQLKSPRLGDNACVLQIELAAEERS